jgi:hypothetical protein
VSPTPAPSANPTVSPTPSPTTSPTPQPTAVPTPAPTFPEFVDCSLEYDLDFVLAVSKQRYAGVNLRVTLILSQVFILVACAGTMPLGH